MANNQEKNRHIVRDLLKESSLSSDDTIFLDLPRPAVPCSAAGASNDRIGRGTRSVEIRNLDVHPTVAAFLYSRMNYHMG